VSFTDDTRVVIYNRNMFIVLAIGLIFLVKVKSLPLELKIVGECVCHCKPLST
jgi:hypothetical protein